MPVALEGMKWRVVGYELERATRRLVAKARRCGPSGPDAGLGPSGTEGAGGRRGGRLDGGAGDLTARSRRRALGVHHDAETDVHVVPLGVSCLVHTTDVVLLTL